MECLECSVRTLHSGWSELGIHKPLGALGTIQLAATWHVMLGIVEFHLQEQIISWDEEL